MPSPSLHSGAGAASPSTEVRAEHCRHCGSRVPGARRDDFCCDGCRAVHRLLGERGLSRYYELRGAQGAPVASPPARRLDHAWIEVSDASRRLAADPSALSLDVQGVHCSACVWLIDSLFQREPGAVACTLNPAVGTLDLRVQEGFSLDHFATEIERFGYQLGPARKHKEGGSALLLPMAICVAIAMNAMSFAIAIYAGLASGPVYELLRGLGWGLSVVSVIVGGPTFFRSAWAGLRRGVVHLDTTIALGIALGFIGTTWSFFEHGEAEYFDTLTAFIALMLVGRFLRERVVARNRRELMASDGVDGLLTRRETASGVELVPASTVRKGDRLLIAPSDLIPVDARLDSWSARLGMDWISGESAPRAVLADSNIPAGAFNVGDQPIVVVARTDFDASMLVVLLRRSSTSEEDGPATTAFWQRISTAYVAVIVAASTGGFLAWFLATGSLLKAIDIATAALVVSCPCALALATPLAHELVAVGLRRAGLFIRRGGFLDRARQVEQVIFDKTGTLTTGSLELVTDEPLRRLDERDRAVLRAMVQVSTHPKSVAISKALGSMGVEQGVAGLAVREQTGRGLEAFHDDSIYRLGKPLWTAEEGARPLSGVDVAFTKNGALLAGLSTRETLRIDAEGELAALAADGISVAILSGDRAARVEELAARLGVDASRVAGDADPSDKARYVESHDPERTLFVGDGINDALALDAALCSGTPAIDRPFVPARCDFYFTTPGLAPIRKALEAARAVHRVTRFNLFFAVVYNVTTIGLALAGKMSPLVAAVLMPVSSLAAIAWTTAAFSKGARLWRS